MKLEVSKSKTTEKNLEICRNETTHSSTTNSKNKKEFEKYCDENENTA